jgi:predicted Ser/Thr protein kinase
VTPDPPPPPTTDACLDLATLDALAAGAHDPTADEHAAACERCGTLLDEMRSANRFLQRFRSGENADHPGADARDPASVLVKGYQVRRMLAFGGQGAVYHAVQAGTGRPVAIKVPLADTQRRPSARYRFEREIELTARLDHPAIVRVIGPCQLADGRAGCVMDFIEGQPFDRWADARRPTARGALRDIVRTTATIADAIAYAHQRAVLHRDIKPTNVVVSPSGEPHVLDFGLAKALGDSAHSFDTLTGAFIGTLAHAAPEQVSDGAHAIDMRTDVYALGLLLFRALTGRLPHETDAPTAELLRQIREAPTPRPSSIAPDIDHDLDAVLLRALAKEKDRRYASAAELRDDLLAWLQGRAVRARFDSRWYVLRKSVRRHRWPVMLGAAGLAVVVTAATLGLIASAQASRARLAAAVRDARTLETHWVRMAEARAVGSDNFEAGERMAWDALLEPERVLVDRGIEGDAALGATPTSAAFWSLWEIYARTPVVFSVPDVDRPLIAYDGSTDTIIGAERDSGRLRWWDWSRAEPVRSMDVPEVSGKIRLTASPDGRWLALFTIKGRCFLLDTRDGARLDVNRGERTTSVMLSDDRAATVVRHEDGRFEWRLFALGAGAPAELARESLDGAVWSMVFDASGASVGLITESGEIRVFDAETGAALLHHRRGDEPRFLHILTRGAPGEFVVAGPASLATFDATAPEAGLAVASRPSAFIDGSRSLAGVPGSDRYLAVSDRFRVGVGRRSSALMEGEYLPAIGAAGLVMSNDGRFVCGTTRPSERGFVLDLEFDAVTRLPMAAPATESGYATVFGLLFGPDDGPLWVGAMDGSIRRFDVTRDAAPSGQPMRIDAGVTAMRLCDGALVVGTHDLGLGDARVVRIRERGNHERLIGGQRWIASLESDGASTLWTLTGEGRLLRIDATLGATLAETQLPRHPDIHTFRSLARLAHRRLLVAGPAGDGVLLLDDTSLRTVASVAMAPIREVVVNPADPDLLATAGDDGMIRLWRYAGSTTPTLQPLRAFGAHAGAVFTLAFSPDGRLLASGGGTPESRDVRLWDVASGRELASLDLFELGVFELAFSPDGRWLAAGGEVRLDAPEEGGQLFLIDLHAPARCIAGNLEYHIARLTETLGREPAQTDALRRWADDTRRAEVP